MKDIPARLVCIAALLLAGCASIPEDFEQPPSYAWSHPETTAIGKFFDSRIPKEGQLSGVRMIRDPREAFLFRFGFAAQAQHTLDMQYYLWKSDSTGRLLLYQAIRAADRGVKVRLLIDDIYHSGRDLGYATIDDRWDNYWRQGPNAVLDWRGPSSGGFGAKSLGQEVGPAFRCHLPPFLNKEHVRGHAPLLVKEGNGRSCIPGRRLSRSFPGIDLHQGVPPHQPETHPVAVGLE